MVSSNRNSILRAGIRAKDNIVPDAQRACTAWIRRRDRRVAVPGIVFQAGIHAGRDSDASAAEPDNNEDIGIAADEHRVSRLRRSKPVHTDVRVQHMQYRRRSNDACMRDRPVDRRSKPVAIPGPVRSIRDNIRRSVFWRHNSDRDDKPAV
jgi:hypothetical protein